MRRKDLDEDLEEMRARMMRMSNALKAALYALTGDADMEDAIRTLKGSMGDFQRADAWLVERDGALGRRVEKLRGALEYVRDRVGVTPSDCLRRYVSEVLKEIPESLKKGE